MRVGGAYEIPPGRRFYVVAGKGGVGKTSIASAAAVVLARKANSPVLLLSVDPAGSLSDVWQCPVGDDPSPAPDVEMLLLRQVDATKAWENLRDLPEIELSRVILPDASNDRAVESFTQAFTSLTPPGVDELGALVELVDLSESRSYSAVVIDTAPTGHFLRLLEASELALEWSHELMRLLLAYREVASISESGDRILRFARSVRKFQEDLRDTDRTWIGIVALTQTLSIAETTRLCERLRRLGLDPNAVFFNRALVKENELAEGAEEAVHEVVLREPSSATIAASDMTTGGRGGGGPRGARELGRFAASWRLLDVEREQVA